MQVWDFKGRHVKSSWEVGCTVVKIVYNRLNGECFFWYLLLSALNLWFFCVCVGLSLGMYSCISTISLFMLFFLGLFSSSNIYLATAFILTVFCRSFGHSNR